MRPLCSFLDCHKPQVALGLCSGHYDQKRLGKQLKPIRTLRVLTSGDEYHWLTVIGPAQRRGWTECVCRCGETKIVKTSDLVNNGGTKSCGCRPRDHHLAPGESARKKVLTKYKSGAAKRNLIWTITDDEFYTIVTSDCVYCGENPSKEICVSSNGSFTYNGVDRINNKKGYTPDNSVSCCKICNWAKGTMSADEFLSWRKRIAANL